MRRGSAKYGTGPVPGGSGGPGDPPDPPVDPEFTILSGGNPGQLYVLAYAYDLNGRRISLSYPSLLRPYSRAAAEYLYTDWGALEAIRGLAGEWYSFGYDEESRLTSIVYPQDTGLTESFVYDSDGRRIIRKLGTAAMPGSVYDDSLVYDWRGKVTKAFLRASSRVVENWYDGLGRVVASSWQSTISGDLNVDQFRTDPYGNIAWSRKRDGFGNAPEYENHYDPYGRITLVQLAPTSPNPSTWSHEWREYDAAGNVSFAAEVRFGPGQMEPTTEVHRRTTRYYYSADKRLVYSQRFARDPIDMGGDSDDLFEEIRYDALGRRILVRTQHAPFGAVGKSDAITRFVWDGDQLLGELRASGDQLEATFGTGRQYGRVTYLHGGEIDKPLGVYRNDFSNAVGPTLIVPYVNWRGQHERGTFVGGAPECTGSHSDCIHVEWPAPKMRTYLDGQAPGEGDWVGSLLQDQLDESGLLYRRNRYYDPNTGQFTQEDPIGIAGGLNLYGFADGDPLTYSDPFGLCPYEDDAKGKRSVNIDDCPDDDRKEIFERLQMNRTGMWAISAIAQLRLNVSMDASPCPRNARGCADPDGTIRLRPGRSASALAQTTVHETVHFYLNSIGIEYGWPHEVVAHTVGYYFYNQLPASLQDDRTLSFWAKKLQADPITALSEICQGGYAHLGCQE